MPDAPIPKTPPGEPPSAIQTRKRAVQIASTQVQPTMRLYVQDEDSLQLVIIANFNNAQVNFMLRVLTPDGQIVPTVKTVIAPNAGVQSSNTLIPLGEGYLLSAVTQSPNLLANGQWIYSNISLLRGGIPNQNVFDEIIAGYTAHNYAPSWPDWPPQRPTDGPGTPVSVTVANPAAGVDWNVTVPALRRWQLLAIRATLTASAAVANRFPGIIETDGANQLFLTRTNTAVVAGTSISSNFAAGVQQFTDGNGNLFMPLPTPDILEAGYVITAATLNLQAADQWSAIQLMVQEWCDLQ